MRILITFKFILSINIIFFCSVLFAQGPVIKDGKWDSVISEEMNSALIEQLNMLQAMAKTEPSIQKVSTKMEKQLEEAKQARSFYLTEEQAEHGVIIIFDLANETTQSNTSAACQHTIEWLEKNIGAVSGICKDGSIIKGEVSVPNDLEIYYKATITPVDGKPYPIGWDAKWVGS